MQVWINLQKIFTEDKFTEARSNVFKSLDTDISELSNNDINDLKENIKIVCRKMDEFCHLKSFFWKRKIIKYWWNPVGKAWGLLQPVVRLEREETRWPKKWEAFEYMGNKCLPMFSMDEKSEFAEKAKEIISLFNNKK